MLNIGTKITKAKVLAVVVGVFGAISLFADGVTPKAEAAACKTAKTTHYKYNDFGQVTRGIGVEIYFCYNGSTITSYSLSRWHKTQYLWNFEGWTGTSKQGGVGWSGVLYQTTGYFRECVGYCFRSDYMTIKIGVYGNGYWFAEKWG